MPPPWISPPSASQTAWAASAAGPKRLAAASSGDDAARVYPLIARSEQVLYVSRVKYGSYAPVMKTMLERAIPVQQAFLRIHNGETHHVQRAVVPKDAVILAYGADRAEERALFTRLVERNAHNMSFRSHRVRFVAEGELEAAVGEEVARW